MNNLSKRPRQILGLFLIGYAMNQFFHVIPGGYGQMPERARDFLDAIVTYLPFLYIFEIIVGVFLVFDRWSRLILIFLFPTHGVVRDIHVCQPGPRRDMAGVRRGRT